MIPYPKALAVVDPAHETSRRVSLKPGFRHMKTGCIYDALRDYFVLV